MVSFWISKIWTISSITTHSPTRHATQPVTEDEVSQAARMADASDSASASHDSDCTPARRESRELPERLFLELECYSGQPWFDWFCKSHDNNFLEVPHKVQLFHANSHFDLKHSFCDPTRSVSLSFCFYCMCMLF